MRYVLDSYALLALFEDESGAGEVEVILDRCTQGKAQSWLSIVNFGELLYITEREQGIQIAQRVVALVDQLPIQIVNADRTLTFEAAHIKAHFALSYADTFVVALARQQQASVVTGDPEFRKVAHLIDVLWIGDSATH